MTASTRLSPAEREARTILVSEGYRVLPMRSCFVSRHKPVNLIGMRGPYEMIYLRLKYIARIPDDPATIADCCRVEGDPPRPFPAGDRVHPASPGDLVTAPVGGLLLF